MYASRNNRIDPQEPGDRLPSSLPFGRTEDLWVRHHALSRASPSPPSPSVKATLPHPNPRKIDIYLLFSFWPWRSPSTLLSIPSSLAYCTPLPPPDPSPWSTSWVEALARRRLLLLLRWILRRSGGRRRTLSSRRRRASPARSSSTRHSTTPPAPPAGSPAAGSPIWPSPRSTSSNATCRQDSVHLRFRILLISWHSAIGGEGSISFVWFLEQFLLKSLNYAILAFDEFLALSLSLFLWVRAGVDSFFFFIGGAGRGYLFPM